MLAMQRMNDMTNWAEKLRLKGMAEEDIYFARRDRELIDAMHKLRSARQHQPDRRAKEKTSQH